MTQRYTTPEIRQKIINDAKKMPGTISGIASKLCTKYHLSEVTIRRVLKGNITPTAANKRVTEEERLQFKVLFDSLDGTLIDKIKHIAKVTGRGYTVVKYSLMPTIENKEEEKMFDHRQPFA